MEAARVNASMLSKFTGRLVCLVGNVTEINPTGTELKVLASDDKVIRIVLPEQLDEALQGTVEVVGRVERDCSITAQRLIPYGGKEEFDLNIYNEAITLASNFPEMCGSGHSNGFGY